MEPDACGSESRGPTAGGDPKWNTDCTFARRFFRPRFLLQINPSSFLREGRGRTPGSPVCLPGHAWGRHRPWGGPASGRCQGHQPGASSGWHSARLLGNLLLSYLWVDLNPSPALPMPLPSQPASPRAGENDCSPEGGAGPQAEEAAGGDLSPSRGSSQRRGAPHTPSPIRHLHCPPHSRPGPRRLLELLPPRPRAERTRAQCALPSPPGAGAPAAAGCEGRACGR